MANLPQDIILYLCIFKRCLDAIIEGFVGPSIPGVPLVAYNSEITVLIKIYIYNIPSLTSIDKNFDFHK